ncbi:hypothetical protein CEUSTIGMA_g8379.t1 [Chlamydomonas eustigma]|uniref:monogalactosyldiacylglycerol synthase n=1 Tax=Chlamydomonas eustigma TaxID=1157962 RepID=A0A250XCY3_9CHLO|nr:hypothetical protein CEUSTIGMA_g8379.t1 [Chlamydomonas eustigma]|eukprot:GAX80944.1 hypothetical protein CEUSTIGMA_g8379.t1 [Chlamydomonas eustigma]
MAVIGTAPDEEVRLLPPMLPINLIPRRESYHCRPRAEASSAQSEASSSASSSTSQLSSSYTSSNSGSSNRALLTMPKIGSIPLKIGMGGTIYFGAAPCKAVALWPFGGRLRAPLDTPKVSKRILIMMSNTGGGHKASADAIKAAFQEKYGDDYDVLIEDIWKDHTPAPFNRVPDTYSFMVRHAFLWWFSYVVMQPRWVHSPYLRLVHSLVSKRLNTAFNELRPDLVVSVHPLMQHVPIRVMKSRIRSGLSQPINFATVVTDFTTCHNTWFHPEATRCFVPTEYCKQLAVQNGLKEPQIVLHGLPIRPIFSKPLPTKKMMKKALGLNTSLPAILLVGGGEGMGKLEDTVDQIAEKLGSSCQVVVVCGRNKRLLQRLSEKRYTSGMPVTATGFIDNIHEYMHASDAIITKAGPGTIAEALISGLPILLNGNVPCQEEGNIPYVVENGVGAFETRPPKIANILASWLSPLEREEFVLKAERSKALGRPEAVYKIVQDLATLAHVPDFQWGTAKAAVEAGRVPQPTIATSVSC